MSVCIESNNPFFPVCFCFLLDGSKTHSTSKDSYQTMTVKRLRGLLKERGLMVKGKKDELIARLTGI
ncbi:hypothetical protein C5167_027361 [Papaver somniferum]|nr:hypothetical protein C5167_027361 [Papaver somniferum]